MHTITPTPDDQTDQTDQTDQARRADHERRRLVTLMAAMAEGDQAAVFALVAELGHHLAGVVRAQLRTYGRRDLLRDRDEIDGLVVTAAFEILDRAGSWDPDGAPPWIWARHAIRAAVVREIGHPSVELDLDGDRSHVAADRAGSTPRTDRSRSDGCRWATASAPAGVDPLEHRNHDDDPDPFDPLGSLDPRLRLLGEAIGLVASPRDQLVVRQFLLQKAYGDPSPSHTVAGELGLTSDNVRQIVSRTRRRLVALLDDDDRYRLLGESGWLAA